MQSGSQLTEDGRSVAGTLAYMSPEQKEGSELDARSDLYACGIILFEMLTGERPQGGEVPSSLRSEVPAQLDGVFRRCYTRRERRYASADEMLTALSEDRQHRPPPPRLRGTDEGRLCQACHSEVHGDDQFCIHCGHQLAESVPRCSACQAYVHASDRFCILCGNDLRVLSQ
jgi:serine/threonine-protein kinase